MRGSAGQYRAVLPVSLDTIRLFLHVLGATVWVGGQLTLAGLLPTLRGISPDGPRLAARRFNVIGWSAFGLLVVTGIWNMFEVNVSQQTNAYLVTFTVKIVVVVLSGASAAAHIRAKSKAALAIGGAVAGLTALVALFLGVLLHG